MGWSWGCPPGEGATRSHGCPEPRAEVLCALKAELARQGSCEESFPTAKGRDPSSPGGGEEGANDEVLGRYRGDS